LVSSILQQEGVLFHCLFSFKQSTFTEVFQLELMTGFEPVTSSLPMGKILKIQGKIRN